MKRKRFIKLLMGRLMLTRNADTERGHLCGQCGQAGG